MRTLILLLAVVLLSGCPMLQTKPNVPKTVTVVVEKFKPLPDWATTPLPEGKRVNNTVREHLRVENADAAALHLANCHRSLLAKLDKGEAVDKKACTP